MRGNLAGLFPTLDFMLRTWDQSLWEIYNMARAADQGFLVFPPGTEPVVTIYRHVLLYCASLYCTSRWRQSCPTSEKMVTCFVVVSNWTHNIFKVCLYPVTGSHWPFLHGNVGLNLSDILIVQANLNPDFHVKFVGFKNFVWAKQWILCQIGLLNMIKYVLSGLVSILLIRTTITVVFLFFKQPMSASLPSPIIAVNYGSNFVRANKNDI